MSDLSFNDKGSTKKDDDNKETITTSCDTLNDERSHAPPVEDISIFCNLCQEFIYYGDIGLHRRLHICFCILQIDDAIGFNGLTFKNLVRQRNSFIKHSKSYPAIQRQSIINKVDNAYSIVYNYLIDEKRQEVRFNRLIKEESPYKYGHRPNQFMNTKTIPLYSDIIPELVIESAINSKLKENEPSVCTKKISEFDECFALLSGVDGNCAKRYMSETFLDLLESNYNSEFSEGRRSIQEAIDLTVVEMDRRLSTGLYDNVTYKSWSGCCLELMVITKGSQLTHLTVANIGDGRVILVQKNNYQVLSSLHSMKNEKEVNRIKALGGCQLFIHEESYLNGITQTTQLIGGYGNGNLKKCQMPTVNCVTVELNRENDLGVIIMNRELARLIPEHDAVEIFKSELNNAYFPVLPVDPGLNDIFKDLTSNDSLSGLSDSEMNSIRNKVKENEYSSIMETKSRIIARKLANASVMCSSNDCNVGAIVFLFNRDS